MSDNVEFYDAALPHIVPDSGQWCPCALGATPLVKYTHFMLNPFSGSDALCDSVHSGECVSLDAADVTCPRCLPLMNTPAVIESEARWRAIQSHASQEWRRSNPEIAEVWERSRRK